MIRELEFFYEACQNPPMVLHRVMCCCARRLARAIGAVRQQLPCETERLGHLVARARWEALTEMRDPALWYAEHARTFEEIREAAPVLSLDEEAVTELCDAAQAFGSLGESPLMTALTSLLGDDGWEPRPSTGPTMLLPYGCSGGVLARRIRHLESALGPILLRDCTIGSLRDVRRSRQHLRNAVFLGSPGAFGDSVITCPVATYSFFIFYDFVTYTGEDRDWDHAFIPLAPPDARLPTPHWARFDRAAHQHNCPSELPQTEEYQVRDQDVFRRPTFHERVQRTRDEEGGQAETEDCVLVDLAGGLWAGIAGNARKFYQDDGRWKVKDVDPEDLEPGDLILLLAEAPEGHATKTEQLLVGNYKAGLDLWRVVQGLGRERIQTEGWSRFRDDLIGSGIRAPYPYWFDEGRLGPSSEGIFRQLCATLGLHSQECNQAWEAMRAWRSYRIQYGFKLIDSFTSKACQTLAEEGPPDRLLRLIQLDDISSGNYALIYVEHVAYRDSLPATRSRRVLMEDGRPWSGPIRAGASRGTLS